VADVVIFIISMVGEDGMKEGEILVTAKTCSLSLYGFLKRAGYQSCGYHRMRMVVSCLTLCGKKRST
jgi:hypothetical protein